MPRPKKTEEELAAARTARVKKRNEQEKRARRERKERGLKPPHWRTVKAAADKAIRDAQSSVVKPIAPKETRLPQSPKQTALRKERKPKSQSPICRIPKTPPLTEYTYIPELKMSVHIPFGKTQADMIAKYKTRPGAKISKW